LSKYAYNTPVMCHFSIKNKKTKKKINFFSFIFLNKKLMFGGW